MIATISASVLTFSLFSCAQHVVRGKERDASSTKSSEVQKDERNRRDGASRDAQGAAAGGEDGGVPALIVEPSLEMLGGKPSLQMMIDGEMVIRPDHNPLYSNTPCTVTVTSEPIPEGVMLHYTITNNTSQPASMPELKVCGIDFPRHGVQVVDNWKMVFRRDPHPTRTKNILHQFRSYPREIYSPVLGMQKDDLFIASSLQFDVLDEGLEVNLDYWYNQGKQSWEMVYTFWDLPIQVVNGQSVSPPHALLDPGQTLECSVAVTAVPAEQWVHAYRPYRDYFVQSFGEVRYQRSDEPIFALPIGNDAYVSPNNPRGYADLSPYWPGRMDQVGWDGFPRYVRNKVSPLGYRRLMIWYVNGLYYEHPEQNMVWEVASAWTPAMENTAFRLQEVCANDAQVGFWMGRAFAISSGFDSGEREAWNPDSPEHNERMFAELDQSYALGVRMIGLDATLKSVFGHEYAPPSDVQFEQIFPMLHDRYPEMQWVIEPSACDFLHLWGSSFIWLTHVYGPFEFADYIAPGHETNAVLKRGRPAPGSNDPVAHMTQSMMDKLMNWGYTPIVFDANLRQIRVNRSLIQSQESARSSR